jgi:hypothetical protein
VYSGNLLTGVLGQPIRPLFKGQEFLTFEGVVLIQQPCLALHITTYFFIKSEFKTYKVHVSREKPVIVFLSKCFFKHVSDFLGH